MTTLRVTLLLILLSACTSKPTYPDVTLMTVEVTNQQRTKSYSKLQEDYFDVDLSSYKDGKFWGVVKYITKLTDADNPHMKWIELVDVSKPDSSMMQFTDPQGFLNYMSKAGYEMVDQKKVKYHIEYTFKRKTE